MTSNVSLRNISLLSWEQKEKQWTTVFGNCSRNIWLSVKFEYCTYSTDWKFSMLEKTVQTGYRREKSKLIGLKWRERKGRQKKITRNLYLFRISRPSIKITHELLSSFLFRYLFLATSQEKWWTVVHVIFVSCTMQCRKEMVKVEIKQTLIYTPSFSIFFFFATAKPEKYTIHSYICLLHSSVWKGMTKVEIKQTDGYMQHNQICIFYTPISFGKCSTKICSLF